MQFERKRDVNASSPNFDDNVSQMSYQSGMTFSSLYSNARGNGRANKLFNMKYEKGTVQIYIRWKEMKSSNSSGADQARLKLLTSVPKMKMQSQKPFYAMFDDFLHDPSGLADKVFSLAIMYIAAMIQYEKVILANVIHGTEQTFSDVNITRAELVNRLTELSYCYSQILQKHNFRKDTILTFRDTISEKLFYEHLYKMTSYIVQNQFDNAKLHPYIDAEIARLFRTESFALTKKEKKEMNLFIEAKDLYHLKHELGVKLPSKQASKRKAAAAISRRSPLITSVFPPSSKLAYDREKGIDRGLEYLRMHIPPDVLFELPQKQKGDSDKRNTEEDEPERLSTSKSSRNFLPSLY